MNSIERHQARRERRIAKRLAKKESALRTCNDFNEVFSYEHLYRSYKQCKKGVSWKASVQRYIEQAPLRVYRTWMDLQEDRFKTNGFVEFDILERGKKRHIRSVDVNERVVQRCLCDYCLVPALCRTFISDNGASRERKGYTFAMNRVNQFLHEHYRKYGNEGYVLLYDFSKFFDRVSHELVKQIMRSEIYDARIIRLCDHFVDAFGDIGLGLGSQISQVLALATGNRLDHYIKEQLQIRGYVRYMDDGCLIHHSKKYLQHCLDKIQEICDELHITLNRKKTQIVKLSRGFTFLKVRFYLTKNGRIVRKLAHRSVVRMRRKLKALKGLVDCGKLTHDDIYMSVQSWRAYAHNFNSYHTIRSIEILCSELFDGKVIL